MLTDKTEPRRKRFEYKIFGKNCSSMDDFNRLGQDGWEIIHLYFSDSGHVSKILAKREIVDADN